MDPTITVILFIVALGFMMLVMSLIPAIKQLKKLLVDLEKTSAEARELTIRLKEISVKVDQDVEKFNAILDSSKEAVETVSKSMKFVNKNIIKHSAGFFALIPAIRLGWDLVKKIKGGKKHV